MFPKWSGIEFVAQCSLAVYCCALLFLQINELNIFVFKHLFVIPSSHPLLFFHHGLLVLSSAPAVRWAWPCSLRNCGAWFECCLVCSTPLKIRKEDLCCWYDRKGLEYISWILSASTHTLQRKNWSGLSLSLSLSLQFSRQYYLYVTDRNRQRIGTQFWFFM